VNDFSGRVLFDGPELVEVFNFIIITGLIHAG
jgi:hypothetical protein